MVSVKLEMCSNDRGLDNFSGIKPGDIQKFQGTDYKCSDERKLLEQNDSFSRDGVVLMNSDSDMVTLNKDEVKDDGWLSELDDMPLSRRREMLVKDDGWSSELDNMPLLRRREMLLRRTQSARTDNMDSSVSPASERSSMTNHDPPMLEEVKLLNNSIRSPYTERDTSIQNKDPLSNISTGASELSTAVETQECLTPSSSEIKPIALNPCNEPVRNDTSSGLVCCTFSSTAEVNVKIKVEPTMHDEETLPSKCGAIADADFKFGTIVVKTEENGNSDLSDDKIDHMLLRERMKLLASHFHSDSLMRTPMPDMGPSLGSIKRPLESIKPIHIKRPWKKKRTATGSVQVALEEDAPGLLMALAQNGVTLDEIILYENEEDDELADEDDSSEKDSFSELEDVITQLFSQRQPLMKMGHPRSKKDEKATYCLTCLFSLVEQARCLQFRNWPVEWGWSRDLQSFIFIFERHRRIVLERPEYGYATYFFELVDSLPIKWQIKRLVTTMKLGSCGRATLMENKPLLIGEDMSEGEAQVLQQFGWIPNSGLGTMLNYCDRVVHDRRNEKDTSYWRSKIGKLLIDGYNGGRIVPVIENGEDAKAGPSKIKLEPWN